LCLRPRRRCARLPASLSASSSRVHHGQTALDPVDHAAARRLHGRGGEPERRSYELFRAVRLVVDTGLHDQGWTRERAIEYMLENTPMTEGDIVPEVER
jgi:hypothetical protein